MVKLKKGSKRQELARKYNIQRMVAAHKKKIRKLAKKGEQGLLRNGGRKKCITVRQYFYQKHIGHVHYVTRMLPEEGNEFFVRKRKIPEIPNCIFKKDILDNLKRTKEIKSESAAKSHEIYQLYQLIGKCDVVVFVLDVRDPQAYRQLKVEEIAKEHNKKLIILLNKCDLVPTSVCAEWYGFYRTVYPTFIVKTKLSNYGRFKFYNNNNAENIPEAILRSSSYLIGITNLYNTLSNYSREGDSRRGLVVCVVGYPNVGKSSLINSLLLLKSHRNVKGHKRLSTISGQVGSTKVSESYKIDKYIEIYDTPGISFSANDRVSTYIDIYKNLHDPVTLFSKFFKHLNSTEDELTLLSKFACTRGKLQKNGAPDLNAAAISFFDSLNKGHLQYFASPSESRLTLIKNKKLDREVKDRGFKYVAEKPPENRLKILNRLRKKGAKRVKRAQMELDY